MTKQLKITITGDIGSGKTTVGKMLAKKLNYPYFSAGKIFRNLAEKWKTTVTGINEMAEAIPFIDEEVDDYVKKIGKYAKFFIFDSRMAWHFIPDSFKIHLAVDRNIAASRIFEAKKEEIYNSGKDDLLSCPIINIIDDIEQENITRHNLENGRFMKKYNIDFDDLSLFDLSISTSLMTPSEVLQKIIDEMEKL